MFIFTWAKSDAINNNGIIIYVWSHFTLISTHCIIATFLKNRYIAHSHCSLSATLATTTRKGCTQFCWVLDEKSINGILDCKPHLLSVAVEDVLTGRIAEGSAGRDAAAGDRGNARKF